MEANLESLILERGKWPTLPVAERQSRTEASLYAYGTIPVLDERDEDYAYELRLHTADPQAEQQLAAHLSRCVNAAPRVLDAMWFALAKFEKLEGGAALSDMARDLTLAKKNLREAIDALAGPAAESMRPRVRKAA